MGAASVGQPGKATPREVGIWELSFTDHMARALVIAWFAGVLLGGSIVSLVVR
jgi:hypothetical protein